MLSKVFTRWWLKPTIPLLFVNHSIDQQKTELLLTMLKKVNYSHTKAIAMIVQVDNHMPVQLDKISQFLGQVKREYGLKLYGFCQSKVSLESYYLLSTADQIYTLPTTTFQLQHGATSFSALPLLQSFGIQKNLVKSDPKVIGNSLDSFTSPTSSKFINLKFSQIANRIYHQSRLNRIQVNGVNLPTQAPDTMIGEQAYQHKFADKIGCYYQILKNHYPDVELIHLKAKKRISPILFILFLIKVILKYTLLVYLWISHKKDKQKEK